MSSQLPLNIRQATNYIVTTHYFYASILLKRPIRVEPIPTASMDVHGQIRISPVWTADLTVQEAVFLLCHECWHYMLLHCLRRGDRDPEKWNWACDAWINESLIKWGIGKFIEGGVRYPGAETMTVEQLYLLAPDDLPKGGGGGALGNDIDDSEKGSLTEADSSQLEAQAKVEMAQAMNAASQMGSMPAELRELIEGLIHVKTPWYDYMEQFMTKVTESDYSFLHPDREFLSLGLYLPGLHGLGCGKVAIVSDESGSISKELVAYFAGHTNTILTSCDPELVYVIHTTTVVCHVDEFTADEFPITLERRGSGSTDMTAGLQWVLDNAPDVDAIIVLTDGHTPFGDDIGIPTMWAITTDVVAPWGETVHVREHE